MDIISIPPGESEIITLSLFNQGTSAPFNLTVLTNDKSGNITYDLSHNITTIETNNSVAVEMIISTNRDIAENLVVTFTIIAQSILNNGIGNFIEIDVIIMTPPSEPPQLSSDFVSTKCNFALKIS